MSSDRLFPKPPTVTPVTDPVHAEIMANARVADGTHRLPQTPQQAQDGEPGSIVLPPNIVHAKPKVRIAYVTAVIRSESESPVQAAERRKRCVDSGVGYTSESECRHCFLSVIQHPVDLDDNRMRIMCWRERVVCVSVKKK